MSATASLSVDAGQDLAREAFSAFVTDEDTRHALAPIVQERGWSGNRIQGGGVANAVRSLALAPSPQYLIVDLSDSENPRADVSALAEVCEPGTIVIAIGEINDVGLYRDLLATGIHDYLIKPVTTFWRSNHIRREFTSVIFFTRSRLFLDRKTRLNV